MPPARAARRPGAFEAEEIVERLLAAPFVDVEQVPLHHRTRLDSGEMRLALAILDDALRCAVRHSCSPLARQRAEARDAQQWIDSDESAYALSFVPICQVLDLDPEWVRGLVRRRLRDARRPPAWTSVAAAPGEPVAGEVREVA
jgi:hypothetical protein